MRGPCYLCAAVMALLGSLYLVGLAETGDEHTLVATEPDYDCGELRQGDVAEVGFTLVNRAPRPVTIRYVSKGCACSEVTMQRRSLAPNERSEVHARWHVGGRRGKTRADITIAYVEGDGQLELLPLSMRATVKPDLEYGPDKIVFDGHARGQWQIKFGAATERAGKVSRVYATHEAFSASLSPDGTSVTVAFDPKLWSDGLSEPSPVVETTHPHEREIRIPIVTESMD
jgi:hypothetical protein